jgi:hypothetical protein
MTLSPREQRALGMIERDLAASAGRRRLAREMALPAADAAERRGLGYGHRTEGQRWALRSQALKRGPAPVRAGPSRSPAGSRGSPGARFRGQEPLLTRSGHRGSRARKRLLSDAGFSLDHGILLAAGPVVRRGLSRREPCRVSVMAEGPAVLRGDPANGPWLSVPGGQVAKVSEDEVLLLWRALRAFRSGPRPACRVSGKPPSSPCPFHDGCPRWDGPDDYLAVMEESPEQTEERRAAWPCTRLADLLSPGLRRIG